MALIVKINGSINGELMRWVGETEHLQKKYDAEKVENSLKYVHYKTLAFVWIKIQQNLSTWDYTSHGCKFEDMERYGRTKFVHQVTVRLGIRPIDNKAVEGEEQEYHRIIEIESPWGILKRDYREQDIDLMIFTFNEIRRELEDAEYEGTIKYNIINKRENEGWERQDV